MHTDVAVDPRPRAQRHVATRRGDVTGDMAGDLDVAAEADQVPIHAAILTDGEIAARRGDAALHVACTSTSPPIEDTSPSTDWSRRWSRHRRSA
jgi:hypothetical protein